MSGFRPGAGHWRAVLRGATAYAPSGVASRANGNTTAQLVVSDVDKFFVHTTDQGAPVRHMIGVEVGLSAEFLRVEPTGRVLSIDPKGFDRISFIVRHQREVRPGGAQSEMYIVVLKKGDETVYVIHTPGETRVQRRLPR